MILSLLHENGYIIFSSVTRSVLLIFQERERDNRTISFTDNIINLNWASGKLSMCGKVVCDRKRQRGMETSA
jgi:hypothetical protein